MKHDTGRHSAAALAILAAVCYGFSVPLSKLLLASIPPVLLAALLYLGAGMGMAALRLLTAKRGGGFAEARMTRKDIPFAAAMIALDVAAPVFLLLGLSKASPGSAALLGNFEIAATALIAMLFFHESVGRRMWWVIAMITLACFLLSVEDLSSFAFSAGSLYVLLACACWGLENNCTRVLSVKDPMQIVVWKGFGAGLGALLTALFLGQTAAAPLPVVLSLLLGFAAYGLSIYFYIYAQRTLGAARTSAYYAFAPFIGVGLSALLFGQPLTAAFLAALALMVCGAWLAARENHSHAHIHPQLTHEHRHRHDDGHHTHLHPAAVHGAHSHAHTHEAMEHTHPHTPDIHHAHAHGEKAREHAAR